MATVSVQASSNIVVGQQLSVTWSNTSGVSCTGAGLLAGITGATGTTTVSPTAVGSASYSVTCGTATSNEVDLTVLPAMTAIPDPVFQQALTTLGMTVSNGQVPTSQLLAITKLAILSGQGYITAPGVTTVATGNGRIADATGLENFRNLTYTKRRHPTEFNGVAKRALHVDQGQTLRGLEIRREGGLVGGFRVLGVGLEQTQGGGFDHGCGRKGHSGCSRSIHTAPMAPHRRIMPPSTGRGGVGSRYWMGA